MAETQTRSWRQTRLKFIEAGGHTTQSFGFGRIMGQIYALLYLSPKPMCLDEIARELGVSKASVSTTIRQLETWSAVRQVWVRGDRRDFYEAETDFNAVIRQGVLGLLRKKFNTAGVEIERIHEQLESELDHSEDGETEDLRVISQRVKKARDFHRKLNGLLSNPLIEHLL
jgi:DNA-binding transcriptional regulator GbsR (MarR family)